jgi:hypothetical protein
MTEYAVTVEYTGDFIVEAESAEEAEQHVESIMNMSTPDSDWYFKEIVEVKEQVPPLRQDVP